MRKIDKFIARLAKEEREKILAALRRIQGRDFSGFDMKKLGGFSHFYRIRIGKFRIIFEMQKESICILDVDTKNDTTYNF